MLDVPHRGLDGALSPDKGTSTPKAGGKKSDKKKYKKKAKQHDGTRGGVQHAAAVRIDLARLEVALHQLQMRVEDLHAAQLGQEESSAGLGTRLESLVQRMERQHHQATANAQRADAVREHLDALTDSVHRLGTETETIACNLAELAVQPDGDTALFALDSRLDRTEKGLAELRGVLDRLQAGSDHSDALRALGERLDSVESGLRTDAAAGATPSVAGAPAYAASEARATELSGRIDALARDLQAAGREAVADRTGQRAWIEGRLRSAGRAVALGFTVLSLSFAMLLGIDWWHTSDQLASAQAKMLELERLAVPSAIAQSTNATALARNSLEPLLAEITEILGRMDARDALHAQRWVQLPDAREDVLDRLRRLEEGQADLRRESRSISAHMAAPEAGLDRSATAPDPGAETPTGPGERTVESGRGLIQVPRNGDEYPRPAGMSVAPRKGLPPPATLSAPGSPVVLGDRRYMIQLIGFRRESSVGDFAHRFGIANDARYMRARQNGKDWYLVLLGQFPDLESGMSAAARLPAELRKLEPWVRPIAAGTRLLPVN